MIRPPRFHGDLDRGLTQSHAVIGAVVVRLDDIGPMLSQYGGKPVERTGIIRQVDAQTHQASVFHKAALDDAREQSDVDVSAAYQHSHFFPDKRRLRFTKPAK